MSNDKRENVQISPATKRLVPNFKLCKTMPVLSEEKYTRMIEGGKTRNCIEKRNYKKKYTICTVYKVSNAEGYDNTDPLDLFDYSVLSVCISNFAAGNQCITPAIIYRGLTGKVTKGSNIRPSKDQLVEILNSITKLMGTIIDIDESEPNAAFKYCKGRNPVTRSAILPCKYTTTTVNGQDANTVISFDRESPFMIIARDRKQLLTYDTALLDVPEMQNTKMNIMLKNYAMIRVSEIKLHKMTPTLTFADVFKKCRIENASRKVKMDARNTLIKFFEHLKAKEIIKTFELTKRANAFYSIKFTY